MSRGRTTTRRPPARRPARSGQTNRKTGWKPPRRRAELVKAIAGAGGVVVVTVLLVFGMHWLGDDGSAGTNPGTPGTSITTPPVSTPPLSPPAPGTPPASSTPLTSTPPPSSTP